MSLGSINHNLFLGDRSCDRFGGYFFGLDFVDGDFLWCGFNYDLFGGRLFDNRSFRDRFLGHDNLSGLAVIDINFSHKYIYTPQSIRLSLL